MVPTDKSKAAPARISIQGIKASFHDMAAHGFFSNREVQLVECPTFPALCSALQDGRADFGMMAIENSIAGSILPNYGLLERFGFKIIGETYLRIEMNLLVWPGRKLEEIRFALSHPMALLQCEDFLSRHPGMKRWETPDTAEAAKRIRDEKLQDHAAIASRLAAEAYGLEILCPGIETDKRNYTRFIAICRAPEYRADPASNKASLCFEVAHRPGALARVLEVFGQHSVNLTKIQSVPIPGRPYQYMFHVDLEWTDRSGYQGALATMAGEVSQLIHFGEYPRGELPIVLNSPR